jgi:hypothetical protein
VYCLHRPTLVRTLWRRGPLIALLRVCERVCVGKPTGLQSIPSRRHDACLSEVNLIQIFTPLRVTRQCTSKLPAKLRIVSPPLLFSFPSAMGLRQGDPQHHVCRRRHCRFPRGIVTSPRQKCSICKHSLSVHLANGDGGVFLVFATMLFVSIVGSMRGLHARVCVCHVLTSAPSTGDCSFPRMPGRSACRSRRPLARLATSRASTARLTPSTASSMTSQGNASCSPSMSLSLPPPLLLLLLLLLPLHP